VSVTADGCVILLLVLFPGLSPLVIDQRIDAIGSGRTAATGRRGRIAR